jgi:hypothetical protein
VLIQAAALTIELRMPPGAFTLDVGVVMKRILLVLPFLLVACEGGPTQPQFMLVPSTASLSANSSTKRTAKPLAAPALIVTPGSSGLSSAQPVKRP